MEQIKEFWEWYGFNVIERIPGAAFDTGYTTESPDGSWKRQHSNNFPPIDLNNLFKYALKPAIQHVIKAYRPRWTENLARGYIFDLWEDKINDGKAYDKALFEVLDEIRRY